MFKIFEELLSICVMFFIALLSVVGATEYRAGNEFGLVVFFVAWVWLMYLMFTNR